MDVENTRNRQTLRAKLVGLDESTYTTYVFENLDSKSWEDRYFMCTRFPNWEHFNLKIGDEGFVTYDEVIAGQSKWFDSKSKKEHYFNYDMQIFIKFTELKSSTKDNYIL